jgi:hypothetical protein
MLLASCLPSYRRRSGEERRECRVLNRPLRTGAAELDRSAACHSHSHRGNNQTLASSLLVNHDSDAPRWHQAHAVQEAHYQHNKRR